MSHVKEKVIAATLLAALAAGAIWFWYCSNLGIVGRFIAYTMLMVVLIATPILVSLLGPSRLKYRLEDWKDESTWIKPVYDNNRWNVLLDTHSHTTASDGRMTYEESVLYHLAVGFNALAFTDHETVGDIQEIKRLQEKYKDKIVLLPGIELATSMGHVCVIGVESWNKDRFKGLEGEALLQKIVEEAHSRGAVVSINHYPWSTGGEKPRYQPEVHLSREKAVELGFDLMEACNWDDDISPIDMVSYEFCQEHDSIGPCAGTDIHAPEKDRVWGWTLLKAGEFTREGILEELRNRRTDVLFEPRGLPYPVVHGPTTAFLVLAPFYMVGDMFVRGIHRGGNISNLDKKTVASWLAWLYIAYVGYEMVRFFFAL